MEGINPILIFLPLHPPSKVLRSTSICRAAHEVRFGNVAASLPIGRRRGQYRSWHVLIDSRGPMQAIYLADLQDFAMFE